MIRDDVFVEVKALRRSFDVSPTWLQRALLGLPRQAVLAVDGLDFFIRRGQTFGLVGESGCGKSTVARLLAGLYAPSSGQIAIDGAPLSAAGRAKPRVQMIFQDPYSSLDPRWRVSDIIAEPIQAGRLLDDESAIRARVERLLEEVGLDVRDATKHPHEFSGGQRQRISIARAIAGDPELLICDEPTSALDVSVQAQILNLMKDLQEHHQLTILFISHNLPVVDFMSDTVGVMYLGRMVEIGPPDAVLGWPMHPYTRMLMASIPNLAKRGELSAGIDGEVPSPSERAMGCPFRPRCLYAGDRCRVDVPILRRYGDNWAACHAAEDQRLPQPGSTGSLQVVSWAASSAADQ